MAATDHAPAPLPTPPIMPYVCKCNDGPHPATDFHALDCAAGLPLGLVCTWCKSIAVPVDAQGVPLPFSDAMAVPAELETLKL